MSKPHEKRSLKRKNPRSPEKPPKTPTGKQTYEISGLESREMLTIVGFMDVKHASEGGDAGYFRLHRDDPQGVVSVDFVVDSRVGVSGVATNGVDYALLPGTTETHSRGSVTFPDGVLTVDIPVVPFDDLSVEGTEAVTVTLLPALATTSGGEPLYTLGANMQATLLLGDAPPVASGIPRVSGVPEIIRGNDFTLRFHGGSRAADLPKTDGKRDATVDK